MLRTVSYLRLSALVAVIFSLTPVLSLADDYANAVFMIVKLNNRNTMSFILSEKPKVTFDRDSVNIIATSIHTRLYGDVEYITFSGITTSIDKPADKRNFVFKYVDNETVSLRGLEGTETISVMSVDGKLLPLRYTECLSGVDIHLTSLPAGIYLISVDRKLFKIYKK